MSYLRFVLANARFLGFGYLVAFISTFGQTFYIAMYGGEIRDAFDLSHGDFGNVYAVGTLTSGFLLMWIGKAIDRVDLRYYALFLCVALAGACLVMSLAQGVILLTLAIFLLRITGQGLLSQTALVTMARYFAEGTRGRAVSVAALGFPSGQALFPAASVVVLAVMPWNEVWMASAVLLVVLVPPLILLLLKGHGVRHAAMLERLGAMIGQGSGAEARQWTRGQVLRDPRFILAMAAMLAPSFIITGLNFHQVLLVEQKGWALSVYASAFGLYAACQVGTSVLVGTLIDRFGALKLTPFYLFPIGVSCLVLASFDAQLTVVAYMALAGMTGGAGATIISTVWAELYGVLHLGSIKAMVAGLSVISSALAPAVFGWFIDAGVGIEAISVVCGFYAIAACGLLAAVFQPRMLRFWR